MGALAGATASRYPREPPARVGRNVSRGNCANPPESRRFARDPAGSRLPVRLEEVAQTAAGDAEADQAHRHEVRGVEEEGPAQVAERERAHEDDALVQGRDLDEPLQAGRVPESGKNVAENRNSGISARFT